MKLNPLEGASPKSAGAVEGIGHWGCDLQEPCGAQQRQCNGNNDFGELFLHLKSPCPFSIFDSAKSLGGGSLDKPILAHNVAIVNRISTLIHWILDLAAILKPHSFCPLLKCRFMAKQRIHVVCPCCQAGLTVDPESGLVLKSDQKKSDYSFDDALKRQKTFSSKADDLFQKAFENERQRAESLEKKFQEALDSKEELEDPKRPFDWD